MERHELSMFCSSGLHCSDASWRTQEQERKHARANNVYMCVYIYTCIYIYRYETVYAGVGRVRDIAPKHGPLRLLRSHGAQQKACTECLATLLLL